MFNNNSTQFKSSRALRESLSKIFAGKSNKRVIGAKCTWQICVQSLHASFAVVIWLLDASWRQHATFGAEKSALFTLDDRIQTSNIYFLFYFLFLFFYSYKQAITSTCRNLHADLHPYSDQQANSASLICPNETIAQLFFMLFLHHCNKTQSRARRRPVSTAERVWTVTTRATATTRAPVLHSSPARSARPSVSVTVKHYRTNQTDDFTRSRLDTKQLMNITETALNSLRARWVIPDPLILSQVCKRRLHKQLPNYDQ